MLHTCPLPDILINTWDSPPRIQVPFLLAFLGPWHCLKQTWLKRTLFDFYDKQTFFLFFEAPGGFFRSGGLWIYVKHYYKLPKQKQQHTSDWITLIKLAKAWLANVDVHENPDSTDVLMFAKLMRPFLFVELVKVERPICRGLREQLDAGHHEDLYIFSRESLPNFISHCYWGWGRFKISSVLCVKNLNTNMAKWMFGRLISFYV